MGRVEWVCLTVGGGGKRCAVRCHTVEWGQRRKGGVKCEGAAELGDDVVGGVDADQGREGGAGENKIGARWTRRRRWSGDGAGWVGGRREQLLTMGGVRPIPLSIARTERVFRAMAPRNRADRIVSDRWFSR
jgi:hypothetical protein